ncbi:MAG: 30S ribosome-binding factor RbfA [Oscillospiraceae bacterium]|nr:30S ribosome-binding factor RbfA [Oscillospiraceae bacterium]
MSGHKINRINEDVKRELTDIMRMLKDPRIKGLLTIVKVDVSNDLSYCKVFVSSMDGFDAAKEAVKGLKNAAGFVRRELCNRLDLRRSPEIKFIADNSAEHSADILKIINDLNRE